MVAVLTLSCVALFVSGLRCAIDPTIAAVSTLTVVLIAALLLLGERTVRRQHAGRQRAVGGR